MKSVRLQPLITLGLLAIVTGCVDSIVRQLGPDNDPVVVNTQDKFQFTATDLENVNDKLTFVWPTPERKQRSTMTASFITGTASWSSTTLPGSK